MPVCMQSPLQNVCLVNRMWGWGKAGLHGAWRFCLLSVCMHSGTHNFLYSLWPITHRSGQHRSASYIDLIAVGQAWEIQICMFVFFLVGYGGVVLHGADTFRVMQTIWKCGFLCRVTNESEGVSRSSVTGWVRLHLHLRLVILQTLLSKATYNWERLGIF